MGIVVEYAGQQGQAAWAPPLRSTGTTLASPPRRRRAEPDEIIEMTFAKDNAAEHGFNLWTINDVAFSRRRNDARSYHLREGKRYRLRMRNASDDIHPIHLHRHSFEITQDRGQAALRA